jgi:lipoyl(octanoyl) transferase
VTSEADVLQVYLLGQVELDAVLRLQRRLHFDVTGDRGQAILVVCEHPPLVTMGRQASRSHLHVDPAEAGWPVRWVGRGGGAWLHRPGQLAVYAVLPLDRLGLSIGDYLHDLGSVFAAAFGDFSVRQRMTVDEAGVWFGGRLAATIGVSVRHMVTSFGGLMNVSPDLEFFRGVQTHPRSREPMTSLERERHGRLRMSHVRERLVDRFVERFAFSRPTIFTEHPSLSAIVSPTRKRGSGDRLPA